MRNFAITAIAIFLLSNSPALSDSTLDFAIFAIEKITNVPGGEFASLDRIERNQILKLMADARGFITAMEELDSSVDQYSTGEHSNLMRDLNRLLEQSYSLSMSYFQEEYPEDGGKRYFARNKTELQRAMAALDLAQLYQQLSILKYGIVKHSESPRKATAISENFGEKISDLILAAKPASVFLNHATLSREYHGNNSDYGFCGRIRPSLALTLTHISRVYARVSQDEAESYYNIYCFVFHRAIELKFLREESGYRETGYKSGPNYSKDNSLLMWLFECRDLAEAGDYGRFDESYKIALELMESSIETEKRKIAAFNRYVIEIRGIDFRKVAARILDK